MDCAEARRLVEQCFGDEHAFGAVRAHLRSCAECRSAYDALADAEAALAGDAVAMPAPALELLRAVVLDDVGTPAPRSWRGARLIWAATAVAAAAAVVLVVALPRAPRGPAAGPTGAEVPAARGSADASLAAVHPQGLRALCLVEEGGETVVRALGTRPLPGEAPRCTVRDRLGFAVRNETTSEAHLGLLAHNRAGRVHLLFPAAPDGGAPGGGPADDRVPAAVGDAPLDAVLPLDRAGSGPLRVLGVFADRPLDPTAIVAAARGDDALGALGRLGGHVIEITVEIGP